jgi:NAD(P)-dependent dehydrogenase (short-subunit alcohol dehydrogenase family)
VRRSAAKPSRAAVEAPDSRVLITGAAGGIGSAAIAQLRARGADVIGLDLVASDDGSILACDVTDQESVDTAVATAIERLGGLDVLINCAGVGFPQSAGERPDAEAVAVIEINLLGPWRVTAAAIAALRESRGRVVNVASGLAHLTVPFATAYCMSKRGLVAYSDALRIEHGDAITVTTVYPGYIRTPIHEAAAAKGLGLEGTVPAEDVSDAASTLVRAALDEPARDLATTRRGTVGFAVLRLLPRPLVDRIVRQRLERSVRAGAFAESTVAADFRKRVLGSA